MLNYCNEAKIYFGNLSLKHLEQVLLSLCKLDSALCKLLIESVLDRPSKPADPQHCAEGLHCVCVCHEFTCH